MISLQDAAVETLRSAARPLHYKKIAELARREGLVADHEGLVEAMKAALQSAAEDRDALIIQPRANVYTLREGAPRLASAEANADAGAETDAEASPVRRRPSRDRADEPVSRSRSRASEAASAPDPAPALAAATDDEDDDDEDDDDDDSRSPRRRRRRRRGEPIPKVKPRSATPVIDRAADVAPASAEEDDDDDGDGDDSDDASSPRRSRRRRSSEQRMTRDRGGRTEAPERSRGGRSEAPEPAATPTPTPEARDEETTSGDERPRRTRQRGASTPPPPRERDEPVSPKSAAPAPAPEADEDDDEDRGRRGRRRRRRGAESRDASTETRPAATKPAATEATPAPAKAAPTAATPAPAKAAPAAATPPPARPAAAEADEAPSLADVAAQLLRADGPRDLAALARSVGDQISAAALHAALIADNLRRTATGRHPRFVDHGRDRWGAAPISERRQTLEAQLLEVTGALREQTLAELVEALTALSIEARLQLIGMLVEHEGGAVLAVDRSAAGGDVVISVRVQGLLGATVAAIALFERERVGVEQVALLRGSLHKHHGATRGLIVDRAEPADAVTVEGHAPNLAPIEVIGPRGLAERLLTASAGVKRLPVRVDLIDAAFFSRLS